MTDNEGIKVYKSEKMIKLIKDGYECEVMEMIDGHYIIDSIFLEFQEGRSPGVLYAVFCYDQFIPSNNQKTEIYLKNGECHREDGPALIFPLFVCLYILSYSFVFCIYFVVFLVFANIVFLSIGLYYPPVS